MEIILWGNRLKLENNEIYNYRKIRNTSEKIDWCKIKFTLSTLGYLKCNLNNNKVIRVIFLSQINLFIL
jgi:hypothetical protein